MEDNSKWKINCDILVHTLATANKTNVNIQETLTLLKGYAYRLTGEHSRPKSGRVNLVPRAKYARTPPRAAVCGWTFVDCRPLSSRTHAYVTSPCAFSTLAFTT